MAQGLGIAKKGFGMVAKAWHHVPQLHIQKKLYCQNMAQVVGMCC